MAVQADSTAGFVGEVSAAQTPAVFGHGSRYSVEGPGDLKVTAGGAGDRALTVAAGTDWGDAVLATWDGPTGMNAAAGSRWNTLVNRRDWGAETATLTLLQGGTSKSLAPGVQLRNPTPSTGAGYTYADRPLALARTLAGSTAIQEVVDLRCWAGDGGLVAASVEALQYLTDLGTQVRIGDTLYTRVLNGSGNPDWIEDSFAPIERATSFLLAAGAGWTSANTARASIMTRNHAMKHRQMFLEMKRTSATAITAGADGNVGNVNLAQIAPEDRPAHNVPVLVKYLTPGGADLAGLATVTTNGVIELNSLLPNTAIRQATAPDTWSIQVIGDWYVA